MGLLFAYSKMLGYGGVFYVLKSGDITCSGEVLRGDWTPDWTPFQKANECPTV